MLDWLTKDQRTSYAEDSQICLQPETPAPIFAYRALKGAIFGSPEREEEEVGDTIKKAFEENIAPASLIRPSTPPTLRSIVANDALHISPAHRTAPHGPSPAKSILRTPGVPTPRRQKVSVSFKDVRASVSPSSPKSSTNLVRTTGTTQKASPRLKTKMLSTREPSVGNTIAQRTVTKSPQKIEIEQQLEARRVLGDALYVKSAERDMKKLVRYGQRMREYARLSEQENATLKRELEVLRTENERLRRRKSMRGATMSLKPANRDQVNDQSEPKIDADRPRLLEGKNETTPTYMPAKKIVDVEKPRTETVQSSKVLTAPRKLMERCLDPALPPKETTEPRVTSQVQLPPDRLAAARERLRVKSRTRKRALGVIDSTWSNETEIGSSRVDWQKL